ncbi:MAG: M1 family metallopeptidase [Blastocatellia bacterium]|nr:M1 family metallopeptidase [Blastocatellia bacterium]
MAKLLLPFLVLLLLPISAQAEPLSDRVTAYTIRAELDPVKKEIRGSETVTWRNPGGEAVSELQFHLYLNAFRDRKSTFMVESGGRLRGDTFKEGGFGWIDLISLQTVDGEDLKPRSEFIHPDDSNQNDRTVLRVPLSRPVGPQQSITLKLEFLVRLPKIFARTGYAGNYFFVAQWFPKLGVYEPAGMRRRQAAGWNCHQFHADSEFYADFGEYDVTCVVPQEYKIGATGVLQAKTSEPNGRAAYRFVQADVHDFAWTASPDFLVCTDSFHEAGLPDVKLTLLLQPEHLAQKDRHMQAMKHSLSYFGKNYGPYPYPTLTAVDPAYNADGSGGMEYPTLITCGTLYRVEADEGVQPGAPEVVTIHEFGHQYWYGMVASNEFEESWLDEGINTFCENKVVAAYYHKQDAVWARYAGIPLFRLPVQVRPWDLYRTEISQGMIEKDPVVTPAWKYKNHLSYGFNSYSRPALTLRMLENYLGEAVMTRILRTYFERWRFRHPASQDFFDVANEVSGQNLDWFFDQYFRSTKVLDYAIESATSVPGKTFSIEVLVVRKYEATMPVEIEFRFADGTRTRETWDGKDTLKVFRMERATDLVSVCIDPEDKLLLDVNRFNNSFTFAPSVRGPVSLSSRIVFFWQQVLQSLAVFV